MSKARRLRRERHVLHGILATGAACMFGLGVGLAAAELLVRLGVPEQEFWSVAPVYHPVETPGVHYTLEPSLDETVYGVDLRTNGLGFRGPDWATPKPAGTFRIALVGDSHGFGLGVPFRATAGEVATRLLRRCTGRDVEVANLAINGYNSAQELAVLRAYALALEPDLIVIQVSSNDHDPGPYADITGYLIGVPPPGLGADSWGPTSTRALLRGLTHSRLYLWGRRQYLAWRDQGTPQSSPTQNGPPPIDPDWMGAIDDLPPPASLNVAVGQPLRAMIADAKSANVPVVLASYASPPEYRRLLREITRAEGIPWLEILAIFPEAHSYPELLKRFGLGWDPHLGTAAHERWGRALARLIRGSGYLPSARPATPGCDESRASWSGTKLEPGSDDAANRSTRNP